MTRRGASVPCDRHSRDPNRRNDSSSFLPGLSQREVTNSLFTTPSQLTFPLRKSVLPPLMCRDLHVACHGCRSWIVILCLSWINPSLLGECLAIYFFKVSWSIVWVDDQQGERRPFFMLGRYFFHDVWVQIDNQNHDTSEALATPVIWTTLFFKKCDVHFFLQGVILFRIICVHM